MVKAVIPIMALIIMSTPAYADVTMYQGAIGQRTAIDEVVSTTIPWEPDPEYHTIENAKIQGQTSTVGTFKKKINGKTYSFTVKRKTTTTTVERETECTFFESDGDKADKDNYIGLCEDNIPVLMPSGSYMWKRVSSDSFVPVKYTVTAPKIKGYKYLKKKYLDIPIATKDKTVSNTTTKYITGDCRAYGLLKETETFSTMGIKSVKKYKKKGKNYIDITVRLKHSFNVSSIGEKAKWHKEIVNPNSVYFDTVLTYKG